MSDAHNYYLFLLTAVVLVVTPGPDTVLVLSRTLASGASAGLWTLIGTQSGNIVHALLAGIGVSTIVLVFPFAFEVLKLFGVIYLIYLSIQSWRASSKIISRPSLGGKTDSATRYFRQGLTNNLANPKVIVFFVALFPQFVRPEAGSLAAQSLLLGSTLAIIAIAWIGSIVILIGRFRTAVATNGNFLKVANRIASVTFLGLACRLAIEERTV